MLKFGTSSFNISLKLVQLSHLAATLMIADLLTKSLHGTLFLKFRSELLGHFSE